VYVHWIDSDTGDARRVMLDGSGLETIGPAMTAAAPILIDTALDGANFYASTTGATGVIRSVPKTGGVPADAAVAPDNNAFDVDAGVVYWMNDTAIRTLAGDLVTGNFVSATELRADASGLYWLQNNTDVLYRANLDGSGMIPLGSAGQIAVDSLSIDATHAWWSAANAIHRVPKAGGLVETVASAHATRTAPIPGGIAWYNNMGVFAWTQAAGMTLLVPSAAAISGIDACAGWVVWSTLNGQIIRAAH
jgi:hypothetical protein